VIILKLHILIHLILNKDAVIFRMTIFVFCFTVLDLYAYSKYQDTYGKNS